MTAAELGPEQKALLASPYGFGKYYLGLPLGDAAGARKVGEVRDPQTGELYYEVRESDKQRRIVDALDGHGVKVSAATANGAGKTTVIIPTAVLWCMALHPRAKVVLTSGVERQVRAQLFPALKSRESRLKGWDFTDAQITAPNGSVAIGFATNQGGRFEGWHGNKNPFYDLLQHDGPLMIVVDEAKSVQQPIFDAIDRCTHQWLLMASSCGAPVGEFYRSHGAAARFFRTFKLPAGECPHADHAKNLELILKRGIRDPLVRSKVFAEFMEGAEGLVIQPSHLTGVLNNPPAWTPGARRYFCDFAAGGDENVLAEAHGNRARIVAAWRERDTMKACGQFIDHLRRLGLAPADMARQVAGDEGGLGKVMLDRLAELGWRLQRVNNGAKARDAHYKNIAAETWYEGAKLIERRSVIIAGMDDMLFAQLTERTGSAGSNGVLEVESKADMKARGLDSPDRADALLGALREQPATDPVPFCGAPTGDVREQLDELLHQNGAASIPGCDCGL